MKIIYGPKGTGKTKLIISDAVANIEKAKGYIVFIADTNRYTYDVKYPIRLINVNDYDVVGEDGFRGFVKGIVAANSDNELIYIDDIEKITGKEIKDLGNIFGALEKLETKLGVKFVITLTASKEELPDFILKFVE